MHVFCIRYLRHADQKNIAESNIRLVAKAGGGYDVFLQLRALVIGL